MNTKFHSSLNRMALFAALVLIGVILFYPDFMQVASVNIWLNGIIIGTTIFGIAICFFRYIALGAGIQVDEKILCRRYQNQ